MIGPSYAEIEKEFEESLGYIRNDITALCQQRETVNYTVGLLVACGCEVIARGMGGGTTGCQILAELLPDANWKALAKPLFEALRNGLAHKFDTKHLLVDGQSVQIYFDWHREAVVDMAPDLGRLGLFIGTRRLGGLLCERINAFQRDLLCNPSARMRFKQASASESETRFAAKELAAWRRLTERRSS